MTLRKLTTATLLIGSLSAGSCATPGDFCDVVLAPLEFTQDTAAQIVATDRQTAEMIDVQNRYGAKNCSGW